MFESNLLRAPEKLEHFFSICCWWFNIIGSLQQDTRGYISYRASDRWSWWMEAGCLILYHKSRHSPHSASTTEHHSHPSAGPQNAIHSSASSATYTTTFTAVLLYIYIFVLDHSPFQASSIVEPRDKLYLVSQHWSDTKLAGNFTFVTYFWAVTCASSDITGQLYTCCLSKILVFVNI
jgi:hypothetical protein